MKKVVLQKLLLVLVVCVVLCDVGLGAIATRIDGIIGQKAYAKVQFGICVVKAEDGEVVYNRNANKAMVPASNMKIVTSAAALRYLGADHEYKTEVGLVGDKLIVTGSGDPLLGDKKIDSKYGRKSGWIFARIIEKLKERGIETIGDIVVDSTVFDDQRVGANWPAAQLNRWFACEVSGINYNGNCIDMTTKNVNGRIVISIEPETDFVRIINKVKAVNGGKRGVGAYRQAGKPNELVVKGRCKDKEGPFKIAIERPAVFFGFLLAENLNRARIETTGKLIESATGKKSKYVKLIEFVTPMSDCLARCNKDSFGLAAEAMLKSIGGGNWVGGREAVGRYMAEIGVDDGQFVIDDGSGLSRVNRLSANAITKVLLDVYHSKNRQIFESSLSVGGVDGTIGKYFKEAKYKGQILGKTGYINNVRSFSGICKTDKGDYIFSILTNNAGALPRRTINEVAKAICDD